MAKCILFYSQHLILIHTSEDNEIFNDSLGKVKELFHINSENSFYNDKSDETFQVNLNNKLLWKVEFIPVIEVNKYFTCNIVGFTNAGLYP